MLSMKDTDVRAIYVEGSGCYGRNGHEDAAADAVLLARAVGRPVRVQWMRADENGWDPKGPPTLMDLQAGLDASGNVIAWYSQLYVPDGGPETSSWWRRSWPVCRMRPGWFPETSSKTRRYPMYSPTCGR